MNKRSREEVINDMNKRSFEEVLNDIGTAIKIERIVKNLSQSAISIELGHKTDNYVSRIENGHINLTIKLLYKIADALKVDVSHLVEIPNKHPRFELGKGRPRKRK